MNKGFKVFTFLLCASLALMFFSCKSTPKVDDVEEVVEVVEEEASDKKALSDLESLHAKIEAARKEAIKNEADSLYPESFQFVDAEYEAHKMFTKTKIVAAEHIASAQRVLNRYEALNFSALATKAKKRVDGFQFKSYDEAAYALGVEKLSEAEKGYLADFDTETQRTVAEEAYFAFRSILNKAFKDLATTKRQELIALRAEVDAIKAGAADKAGYNSAMLVFTAGEANFAEGEYEDAYSEYLDAHDALSELYERVLEKRAAALRAMEEAREKSEAVDKFALEADEIAPLENEDGNEE
ncbi:MAG: hypothetical protein QM387_04320 [Spirochaetota bacterium]|jgi:hypothetical protein|nr:hypothetical protein [Spirochaetota bacterium]NMA56274.1 hypothetical protein [Treponema sp.]